MPGDGYLGIGPAVPALEGLPFRCRIISSVGLGMLIPDRLGSAETQINSRSCQPRTII